DVRAVKGQRHARRLIWRGVDRDTGAVVERERGARRARREPRARCTAHDALRGDGDVAVRSGDGDGERANQREGCVRHVIHLPFTLPCTPAASTGTANLPGRYG